MSDQMRDWDKEMAKIDKAMARAPAGPGPAGAAPVPAAPARAGVTRRQVMSTWFRVLLTVALVGAMTQWPYLHGCGVGLFLYLGAILVVVVSGIWSAVSSWHRRLGLAHTVSLLVVLAGLGLGAREVLPRVGYAKLDRAWICE